MAVASLPTNFNPLAPPGANPITAEVMAGVLPHAFVTVSDFQQVVGPGFVESAEVYGLSPFTVVYKLNPKAVWSDGVPITAADFVYEWQEMLRWAPLLPYAGIVAGYRAISSITGGDHGTTVTIVFHQHFAEWESLFQDLVPAQVGERYGWVSGFQGFDPSRVISGGPFEIKSFVPGKRLVLVRNPAYWSTPAHLSRIVFVVDSPAATLAGLEDGTVTLAETAPGAQVTNTIAQAAEQGRGLVGTNELSPTLWQLCLNTAAPLFSSVALRQAIDQSLDRPAVTTDSVGLVDWSRSTADDRLAMVAEPGAGSDGVPYSPSDATELFAQAGFVRGSDGELRFGGGSGPVLTFTLDVPRGMPLLALAAEAVSAQLQLAGLRVIVAYVPLSQLLGRVLPEGSYQMALAPFLVTPFIAGMTAVYTPAAADASLPWQLTSPRWSPSGREPGAVRAGVVTRDVFGLSDPTVSQDLSQALTSLTLTKEQQLAQQADQVMWTDAATIPLFQQPFEIVRQSNLVGMSNSPTWAGPFWSVAAWAFQTSPVPPLPTFPGITPATPLAPSTVASSTVASSTGAPWTGAPSTGAPSTGAPSTGSAPALPGAALPAAPLASPAAPSLSAAPTGFVSRLVPAGNTRPEGRRLGGAKVCSNRRRSIAAQVTKTTSEWRNRQTR